MVVRPDPRREDPLNDRPAPMAQFAHQGQPLQLAEDLLDPLALHLTDRVPPWRVVLASMRLQRHFAYCATCDAHFGRRGETLALLHQEIAQIGQLRLSAAAFCGSSAKRDRWSMRAWRYCAIRSEGFTVDCSGGDDGRSVCEYIASKRGASWGT